MHATRPFRFGAGASRVTDRDGLIERARRAEALGYATFGMADHFMIPLAPLVAGQAAADATESIRITQIVLALDFRHPAVLAKELATLDVCSGGRLEIGIGAGWMADEFSRAGIPFPPAPVRIARLEEAVTVLKGLFADGPCTFAGQHFSVRDLDGTPKPLQRPHPPIMIGGGGPKLLAAAARHADIVQVLPGPIRGVTGSGVAGFTPAAYHDKVALIRDAAGDRFDAIELGALLMHVEVTDDPDAASRAFLARSAGPDGRLEGATADEVLASPVIAIGSLDDVCDKLRATRETFGFSYFGMPVGATIESFGPVVERLAGT